MNFSKVKEDWSGIFIQKNFNLYSSLPLWIDLAGSGGGPNEGALLAGGFLYRKSRFS